MNVFRCLGLLVVVLLSGCDAPDTSVPKPKTEAVITAPVSPEVHLKTEAPAQAVATDAKTNQGAGHHASADAGRASRACGGRKGKIRTCSTSERQIGDFRKILFQGCGSQGTCEQAQERQGCQDRQRQGCANQSTQAGPEPASRAVQGARPACQGDYQQTQADIAADVQRQGRFCEPWPFRARGAIADQRNAIADAQ
ncbi:hypothetical protein PSYPI_31486 [Pseudomonas syringae pv. pisi str. 1704B]|uniref:Lipoprotein n=1 Tax=Pseudomonas syringae pv. pisi str. 1704B TaxID=629263 RepID=F3GHN3_PSESJ|nr:hypothetical protein PSYPI_31486 [Pseudomonas syringae pv. pisi str. 1704B]